MARRSWDFHCLVLSRISFYCHRRSNPLVHRVQRKSACQPSVVAATFYVSFFFLGFHVVGGGFHALNNAGYSLSGEGLNLPTGNELFLDAVAERLMLLAQASVTAGMKLAGLQYDPPKYMIPYIPPYSLLVFSFICLGLGHRAYGHSESSELGLQNPPDCFSSSSRRNHVRRGGTQISEFHCYACVACFKPCVADDERMEKPHTMDDDYSGCLTLSADATENAVSRSCLCLSLGALSTSIRHGATATNLVRRCESGNRGHDRN
jgi:hypothetical protein